MFRFGAYEVDIDSQQLRKSGLLIRLQSKPFHLLRTLLEHAGEVVTREELYRVLWEGDNYGEFDHNLNNAINRLRRSLNDCASTPRYIETLPRLGYRFIAPVERETSTVERRAPIDAPAATPGWFRPIWRWAMLAACVFFFGLGAAGYSYLQGRSHPLPVAVSGSAVERQNVRDAHDLYIQGRYSWNKRTKSQIGLAIIYFQEAIDKDPDSALAYSGLADSYSVLGMMVPDPKEFYQKARVAALDSVRLGEKSGEAHASLALVHFCDFRFSEADTEFHKAISLKPDYATAHHWYGLYLRDIGLTAEGLRELNLAHRLDPLSLEITFALANAYRKDGLFGEAERYYLEILRFDPSFRRASAGLALLYGSQHRLSPSLAARWVSSADDFPEVSEYVAVGLYETGKKEEAIQLVNQVSPPANPDEKGCFPLLLAAMGEKEQSIHCLEKGYERRAGFIAAIKTDPMLGWLRSDPRFQNLLARVGFPSIDAQQNR